MSSSEFNFLSSSFGVILKEEMSPSPRILGKVANSSDNENGVVDKEDASMLMSGLICAP